MGYGIALLGEKEGFDKRIIFSSDHDEQSMQKMYDDFRRQCVGVAMDHLPLRCPVRRHENSFELILDDRNLSYNFDSLLTFLGRVISSGRVKAARTLNGGAYGASAYLVKPGSSVKFDCFPSPDLLTKIRSGTMSFMDILKDSSGTTLTETLKKP